MCFVLFVIHSITSAYRTLQWHKCRTQYTHPAAHEACTCKHSSASNVAAAVRQLYTLWPSVLYIRQSVFNTYFTYTVLTSKPKIFLLSKTTICDQYMINYLQLNALASVLHRKKRFCHLFFRWFLKSKCKKFNVISNMATLLPENQ